MQFMNGRKRILQGASLKHFENSRRVLQAESHMYYKTEGGYMFRNEHHGKISQLVNYRQCKTAKAGFNKVRALCMITREMQDSVRPDEPLIK